MRFFYRISIFCYKIANTIILKDFFKNFKFKDRHFFRDREILSVPKINTTKGRLSFGYFFPTFINKVLKHSYNLTFNMFKQSLSENLYLSYLNFEF